MRLIKVIDAGLFDLRWIEVDGRFSSCVCVSWRKFEGGKEVFFGGERGGDIVIC